MKAYRAQGYTDSEAFGRALADRAGEVGLDMLGGALSGGVMAGGSIAINAYQNGRLVNEGLKAPEVFKRAQAAYQSGNAEEARAATGELMVILKSLQQDVNTGAIRSDGAQEAIDAISSIAGELLAATTAQSGDDGSGKQLLTDAKPENDSQTQYRVQELQRRYREAIDAEQKNTASTGETVNMRTLLNETEEEKAARLSGAEITVTRAKKGSGNQFNFAKLSRLNATEASRYLKPILKALGITGRKYSNLALSIEFEYSNAGAQRSISHQVEETRQDYSAFSLVQSNLEAICENAYPLEAHYDEKPKTADNHVSGVATLGSVLQAGSRQIPVRLTIKFYDNAAPKLHIIINGEGSAPVREGGTQKAHQPTESTPATMTIADYFKLVNGSEEFTKRIPDSIAGKNNGSLLVERDIHAELNNAQTSANSQGENAAMSPVNGGEGGETVKLDKRINPGEIEKDLLNNTVTPIPWTAAAKNVKFAENEYGIKAYVIKKRVWNKYSFPGPITSRNGAIFMTNAITRTDYIQHEATHIMAQDGFKPYLEFLERTPDYVDLYSPEVRDLLQDIFIHIRLKDETDISELADNEKLRLHLYDEINATLYGHIANGQIEGKRKREGAPDEIINLSDIVYDLEDYTAQMSAIHEEYKVWKRSGKPVVENHDGEGYNKENSSGSDNHGGEEGTLQRRGAASVPDERGRESSSSSGKGKGGVSTVEKSKSGDLMAGGEIHFSAVDNERAEGEERRSPSTVEKYRRKLEDERTKLKVKKLKLAQGRAMRAIELEDEYEKNVRE